MVFLNSLHWLTTKKISKIFVTCPLRASVGEFAGQRCGVLMMAPMWLHNHVCKLTLRWRHNGRDGVSNHQPHDCFFDRWFGRRSKWTSKLRVTGLCVGNSLGTVDLPAQMASNAENVSLLWHHHDSWDMRFFFISLHIEVGEWLYVDGSVH